MLLAFFTCPFFLVRKNLYKNIKELSPFLKGSILDFGCGAKPYKDLFVNCEEYIGLDIEKSGHDHSDETVDVFYDGVNIPFEDDRFDNIFSSEVYEHVNNIDNILDELRRVLKPGGYMLVTTPFVWNEHEIPYDFHRFTSYGIIELLSDHGFETIELYKSTSYIEMIYQMKAEYYSYMFRNSRSFLLKTLVQLFVVSFQTMKGIVFSHFLPDNSSFYGDNVVLCIKKSDKK